MGNVPVSGGESGNGECPHYFLGWWAAVSLWMTWAPLVWRGGWRPPLQWGLRLETETVGHFFLLMPFAVLLALWFGVGDRRGLVAVAGWGLLLEAGQAWVAGRSLSPHDVWIGYVGALLATVGTGWLLRRGVAARTIIAGLAATTIALVWILMLQGTAAYNRGLSLAGWTAEFGVLSGLESGRTRVYDGTVESASVCAGADLDVCAAPGAERNTRRQVVRAALDSQRVRLQATVTSRSREQEGPARIVTFSDGPYLRNVTLAQRKRNLIFRVRTLRGGPNGDSMEFVLDDALREGAPTRLTATFDRGTVAMSAVSEALERRGTYRPPFRNSIRSQGLARPRVPQPLRGNAPMAGTVVQYLGLGLALGFVLPFAGIRIAASVVVSLGAAVIVDHAFAGAPTLLTGDFLLVALAAATGACSRAGRLDLPRLDAHGTLDRPPRSGEE